jgi:hypothetical protein
MNSRVVLHNYFHFVHSGWTISVLTNASDGFAYPWVDGILSILQNFEQHGAPKVSAKNWRGRWWNLWSAVDLVPMGDHMRAVAPVMFKPFDGNETIIELQSKDRGLITRTSGYLSPGEQVRRVRDRRGNVKEIWFAASQMLPREAMVAQSMKRFAVSNVLQGIDVQ